MMEQRTLGVTDIKITPIIMGTWQAGKSMWVGIKDAEITKAIRSSFDSGITTFDTASVYGDGYSERILGKTLSDVRERVIYATKVFPSQLKYDQVIESCHRSLKNLETDYVDLYQIHWPSGSFRSDIVPIDETMRAMNDLKTQGKIRAIGVSNFSRYQLEEACQYSSISSLQPPYSLFWRQVETDAKPYCIDNNITLLAYSPLAQGLLTGKFKADHKFAKEDNRAKNRLIQPDHYQRVQQALNQLCQVADQKQITPGQLALAWIIHQPDTCAIVGARNEDQALENAKSVSVDLSKDDLNTLDVIGRSVTDYLDDNPFLWG
jgi:aryl-alcohol dehydrogenase-like predicted oxidoreductase